MTDRRLTLASWNVHRGVGRDGRFDAGRIIGAIGEEIAAHRPDILLLQEADGRWPPQAACLDAAAIAAATGLVHANSPALRWGAESMGFHGTAVFLHPDLSVVRADLVELPGVCPRGAVVVELARGLRLVAAHLSLAQWLRAVQLRTLGQYIQRQRDLPTVVAGDLNEWRPWGGLAFSAAIFGRALTGPARRSFPSGRPILPLDRVLGDRPGLVTGLRVLDGPRLRLASDHRPVMAAIRWTGRS